MPTETISGDLIGHVRVCLDLSLEYVSTGKGVTHRTNAYTPYAFPAYVCAVAAVEAFVNEALIGHLARLVFPSSRLWSVPDLDRMRLSDKIPTVTRALFDSSLPKGEQPFQDFDTLTDVRNDLTHYKMGPEPPKYIDALSRRGIALTAVATVPGADHLWPSKLSSVEGIRWANNTASRMVAALVLLVPEEHRDLLCLAAGNFVDISSSDLLSEWQRVVEKSP